MLSNVESFLCIWLRNYICCFLYGNYTKSFRRDDECYGEITVFFFSFFLVYPSHISLKFQDILK